MANVEIQLQAAKAAIEKAKNARIQAETNVEHYSKQLKETEAEITALGVNPENIDAEILKLTNEIDAGIKELDAMIPAQFRG